MWNLHYLTYVLLWLWLLDVVYAVTFLIVILVMWGIYTNPPYIHQRARVIQQHIFGKITLSPYLFLCVSFALYLIVFPLSIIALCCVSLISGAQRATVVTAGKCFKHFHFSYFPSILIVSINLHSWTCRIFNTCQILNTKVKYSAGIIYYEVNSWTSKWYRQFRSVSYDVWSFLFVPEPSVAYQSVIFSYSQPPPSLLESKAVLCFIRSRSVIVPVLKERDVGGGSCIWIMSLIIWFS